MGRTKTPTKILEARGSFKKNPQRRRDGEPEVKAPIGIPPDTFKADEVAAWRSIVERAPLGVLTAADWHSVVIASLLYAQLMRDVEGFNAAKLSRLHSLLGSMGMTPSDRAKLSIEKPPRANPFGDL